METDFWQFWHSGSGFDKDAWFESYKIERAARPLSSGRQRRNTVSTTRRVIEWVLVAAAPIRCLETNLYATPSETAGELSNQQRCSDVFQFLLSAIRPRVILAHGKDACRHLQIEDTDARVIEASHFSRGWSKIRAQELGREIANEK
ncbi:hypothetical protein [Salinisphaera orenii]|uniref:hypothetical protein n=1 Tax=Salinisphaera orenii TaxID=856731 RepID=UPI00160EA25C|nr:hypothetical protein [Salinisphaera halophila]